MGHLISLVYLKKKEIDTIFKTANKLKKSKRHYLKDKSLAMIFEKPSLRTKVSFDVAMTQLGGHAIYLGWDEIQLGKRESIGDAAKVFSRYVDGIMARLFEHEKIIELAKNSEIPVINGLTDFNHPCQALADLYTIKQKKKKLKGLKLVFLGDGSNNTCHSLIYGCEKMGLEMVVSCPSKYKPKIRGKYRIVSDPKSAVAAADVVYTDTWVSMGQEKQKKRRIRDLKRYQLNSKLLKFAKRNAIVMHPLPAHRGSEITSKVMDGKQSVVFDQAENRLHVQKAILYLLMK